MAWPSTVAAQDAPTNPEVVALPQSERAIYEATLQKGLERVLSGNSLMSSPSESGYVVRVTPRRTFRTAAGVFCREYGILLTHGEKRAAFSDIASRDKAGVWSPAR